MAQFRWDKKTKKAIKIEDGISEPTFNPIPAVADTIDATTENVTENIDYDAMTDEELDIFATEKGIITEGMTRRKVINALKREGMV